MKQLNAVDKFIQKLNSSLRKEVLIDVKIYSVELSKSHQTGIDWSKLQIQLPNQTVPLRASYITGNASVFKAATFSASALLNFLAQNGNVNSISNPKIVTLNNQKAIISVGDTIYYKYASKVVTDQNGNPSTEYTIGSKFVGIVLDITPQISDNGEIILSISPRISAFRDLTQLTSPTRGMPPDTKDSTMLSIVKMKDGQTLVLGGLITNDKSLKVNGVPVLKEIPIIKYLFSSKSKVTTKKELVFVITPHIIDLKKKKTLRDFGFGKIR
jgi:general secretion pathway protein D